MIKMLCFSGSAFTQSSYLNRGYAPFLKKTEDIPVYLSLSCEDTSEEEIHIRQCGKNIKIGMTEVSFIDDLSMCVICSSNYRCLAKDSFLNITIRQSYMWNLSQNSYNRLNEALYQVARMRALYLDMLVLHASAVVYQDEVIMFSGMKGAGKSTQARLWLENTDAWILNYDKPVVKLDCESVLVSGSPWGGKEDLAINEVRPAKVLFFVHQAKENRLVRLSSGQAYSRMYLNFFIYPINKDVEDRYNNTLIRIIERIPVYDLYCTATEEAVRCVQRELYAE